MDNLENLSLINSNTLAINSQPNAQIIGNLDESKLINRQLIQNLHQHFQQQQFLLEFNNKNKSYYNNQTNLKFYLTPASAIDLITRSACSSSDFV